MEGKPSLAQLGWQDGVGGADAVGRMVTEGGRGLTPGVGDTWLAHLPLLAPWQTLLTR